MNESIIAVFALVLLAACWYVSLRIIRAEHERSRALQLRAFDLVQSLVNNNPSIPLVNAMTEMYGKLGDLLDESQDKALSLLEEYRIAVVEKRNQAMAEAMAHEASLRSRAATPRKPIGERPPAENGEVFTETGQGARRGAPVEA